MTQLDKYMQRHSDDLGVTGNHKTRLRKKSLEAYYMSPNHCEFCGKVILVAIGRKVYEARKKKFCNHSCSAKASNLGRTGYGKHDTYTHCEYCKKPKDNPYTKFCSIDCANKKRDQERLKRILSTGILDGNARTKRKFFAMIEPYVCKMCGQEPEWKGKSLTLTLDHIDGNSRNNKLENFRWVCPNCDTQLPTYGSKNKGNGRESRYKNKRE